MKNSWLFPLIQAAHLVGMAMSAGTLAVCWITAAPIPARWVRLGFWILIPTGLAMFFADTTRYVFNVAFLAKVVLLLCALWILRRGPAWLRVTWLVAILIAARAIADFDL